MPIFGKEWIKHFGKLLQDRPWFKKEWWLQIGELNNNSGS